MQVGGNSYPGSVISSGAPFPDTYWARDGEGGRYLSGIQGIADSQYIAEGQWKIREKGNLLEFNTLAVINSSSPRTITNRSIISGAQTGDYISIGSTNPLFNGTAEIQFNYTATGSSVTSGDAVSRVSSELRLSGKIGENFLNNGNYFADIAYCYCTDAGAPNSFVYTYTKTLSVPVGSLLQFTVQVNNEAYAQRTAFEDAVSSASGIQKQLISFSSSDPTVLISSYSGVNYSLISSVPELADAPMLVFGLGILAMWRRRPGRTIFGHLLSTR